jgi:hypothetical protein
VRVLGQLQHFDVVELDVQVLVDGLQNATNADVILELNGDRLVGQGLKEAVTRTPLVAIHITQFHALRYDLPEEKHSCGGLTGKLGGGASMTGIALIRAECRFCRSPMNSELCVRAGRMNLTIFRMLGMSTTYKSAQGEMRNRSRRKMSRASR